jgi:hypothetical protein
LYADLRLAGVRPEKFGPAPERTSASHCAIPTRLPWQAAVAFAPSDSLCSFDCAKGACPAVPGIEVLLFPLQAASPITAANSTEALKITFTINAFFQ